jgi:hypothetical protein
MLTQVSLSRVLRVIKDNGGFMSSSDIEIVAHHDRLRQLLVRCGNCRFLCAAQDTKWIMDIIQRDGQDYVRDVSLPTTDPIWR